MTFRLLSCLFISASLCAAVCADDGVVFAGQPGYDGTFEEIEPLGVTRQSSYFGGGCDTCGELSCGCDSGCDSALGCGGGCGGCGLFGFDGSCLNSFGHLMRATPFDWASAEYLMWWTSGMSTPTLLARATEANPTAGVPLVGGSAGKLLEGMRSGMRVRAGRWLDDCQNLGIEADYFFLGRISDSYSVGDDGSPGSTVFTRPFYNALTNEQDAELISFPGVLSGVGRVEADGRFQAAGIQMIWNQCKTCCTECGPCGPICNSSRFDFTFGYRFASLKENLAIYEDLTSLVAPVGGTFNIYDRFQTSNHFHGGNVGVRWQERYNRFTLEMLGRVGFGNNRQRVRINGQTVSNDGDTVTTEQGGLLAQTTNIGYYSRNRFALLPELGVTLGYHLNNRWRATIGYSLIYWDRVVRPGDQIDPVVNPNFLPPSVATSTDPRRPAFRWMESGFVAQGISFGLAYTR